MKKASFITNIILAIAVTILYVLHFSENKEIATLDLRSLESTGAFNFAFINTDSLIANYELFQDKIDELTAKRNKFTRDYERRVESLQNDVMLYQKTAGGLTSGQARKKEQDLMQREQSLMQYQQNLSQELQALEVQNLNDFYDSIKSYSEAYGKEHNLQLMLTYSNGSGVLFASDSLEITDDIIESLNKEYSKVK